jgi:hypothetical protein
MVIILALFCPTMFGRPCVIIRTSMVPRWIQGTLWETVQKQKNGNPKAPSSGLDKVFSPGGLSSILGFSNALTVAVQFPERDKARLTQLQDHFSQMQEIAGRTIPSRDKISQLSAPSFKKFLPLPSAPASQAHSHDPNVNSGSGPTHHPPGPGFLHAGAKKRGPEVLLHDPDAPILLAEWKDPLDDPNHDPNPFTPPADLLMHAALPSRHQSHSVFDHPVEKARKREYLENKERGIGFKRAKYHHQSHSASDRPAKKARTREYHSEMEEEGGLMRMKSDATSCMMLPPRRPN